VPQIASLQPVFNLFPFDYEVIDTVELRQTHLDVQHSHKIDEVVNL